MKKSTLTVGVAAAAVVAVLGTGVAQAAPSTHVGDGMYEVSEMLPPDPVAAFRADPIGAFVADPAAAFAADPAAVGSAVIGAAAGIALIPVVVPQITALVVLGGLAGSLGSVSGSASLQSLPLILLGL
ncbi:hypothetical protein [Rhodococcus marinonascens]|uniref:hypothetical protein n=1 Tax=Rhodococcus marinonascens TaxID=38311 RepID=UPI000933EAB4|nr:hypothetical protein [Rhodococcus marinonascens]